jgi:zona occludens toxin
MYEGWKHNAKTRTGTFVKRYSADVFPLYQSYVGGAGVEASIDRRQNVFASVRLWVFLGVLLLISVSGLFYAWRFFAGHGGSASGRGGVAGVDATASMPGSSAQPVRPAVPAVSSQWRAVGRISANGVSWAVVADGRGRLRVESPAAFMGVGVAMVGEVDGQRVTSWSGAIAGTGTLGGEVTK